ncbi:MAG: hypothetical protein RQ833_08985 [Sphingomonadaceae bacterium]|nr:hypothetical protein [Sphingomonadaceae bacterium]
MAGAFRAPAAQGTVQRMMVALNQIGLRACARVFAEAGQFLFENAPVQFVIQPLGTDTNRWPTVITAEGSHAIPGSTTPQTRLTTLVVAPAGTCSGLYNQVIYWPEPCATVKKRVFAGFAGDKPLLSRVTVSEANPGLQLYAMPAGPAGCVTVKKELIG